jgi:hypothetical protein
MPRRLLGKQKSYASAELLVNEAAKQPGAIGSRPSAFGQNSFSNYFVKYLRDAKRLRGR